MNEEEKRAIELLENIKNDSWTTKYIMSSDSKNAEVLLNLIEKLQKENEEWNRKFCDLQNLYIKLQDESESKRKEYQETYKDVREELRELKKENEELKKLMAHKNYYTQKLEEDLFENARNYVIPIQEVKDKIEEYKNTLKTCNKVKDIDRIKAINERILELEELLEGRE